MRYSDPVLGLIIAAAVLAIVALHVLSGGDATAAPDALPTAIEKPV